MADAEDSLVSAPTPVPPRVARWDRSAALGLFGLVAVDCAMWMEKPADKLDFFFTGGLTTLARGATAFWAAVPAHLGSLHENSFLLYAAGRSCINAFIFGTAVLLPLSLLAALGKCGGPLHRGLWWLAAGHAATFLVALALLGRASSIAIRFSEPIRWYHGWVDDFTFFNGTLNPLLALACLAELLLATAVLWLTRSRVKARPG